MAMKNKGRPSKNVVGIAVGAAKDAAKKAGKKVRIKPPKNKGI